jgi:5'-nucleotidase
VSEKPIYLDMDGVLADFDRHYDQLIGRRTAEGKVLWDEVARYPSFFLDLALMEGARELWAAVPKDRRRILSGFPEEIDYAAAQKRQWLKRNNFEIDEDRVLLVPGRREKRSYSRPGHILIDDWQPVIFAWEEGGGTGIWYRNAEQAIGDLRRCIGCLDIPEEQTTRQLSENASRLGLD